MEENYQTAQNPPPHSNCPQDVELEQFLLSSYFHLASDKRIARHVASCPVCQDKLKEMQDYYEILSAELAHPVPPEVLLLQERIQRH